MKPLRLAPLFQACPYGVGTLRMQPPGPRRTKSLLSAKAGMPFPRLLGRVVGQATVEVAVVSLALVPAFLAVPLLGKYIDVMQTVEASSRYVAFEGSVHHSGTTGWKTDDQLAAEVRRRFFGPSDSPVKTGDVAGDTPQYRNPLWVTHRGTPLIGDFGRQVGVSAAAEAMDTLPSIDSYIEALQLPKDNLYTGTVTVTPSNVVDFAPFDDLNLVISRRTVLLVDSWTTRGSSDVRQRIRRSAELSPSNRRAEILVNAIGQVPVLLYDKPMKLNRFDWDVVPCDRLTPPC